MDVNQHLSPTRLIAALGAAALLTLSACGGSDDTPAADSTPDKVADTEAPAEAPANAPASVTFDAQDSDGTMITVASVELPAPGFIAVHGDGGGCGIRSGRKHGVRLIDPRHRDQVAVGGRRP